MKEPKKTMTASEVAKALEIPSLDLLASTRVFMERAGQLDHIGMSANIKDDVRKLRRKFLADADEGELTEYLNAEFANQPVEVLDGLLDIIVVAIGTAYQYFGPEVVALAASEVARSNLDKVGDDMQKRGDGKVLKPQNWVAPRIREILLKTGFKMEPSDTMFIPFEVESKTVRTERTGIQQTKDGFKLA